MDFLFQLDKVNSISYYLDIIIEKNKTSNNDVLRSVLDRLFSYSCTSSDSEDKIKEWYRFIYNIITMVVVLSEKEKGKFNDLNFFLSLCDAFVRIISLRKNIMSYEDRKNEDISFMKEIYSFYKKHEESFLSVDSEEDKIGLIKGIIELSKLLMEEDTLRGISLDILNKIIQKYKEENQPNIEEQVARVMVAKGVLYWKQGEPGKASETYEEVEKRFKDSKYAGVQEQVAKAMVNRGAALSEQGAAQEALAVYEKVEEEYGASEHAGVREAVASAMFNRGAALLEQGAAKEALVVYKRLEEKYGASGHAGVQEQVARAMFNRGVTLSKQGKTEEALVVYERLEEKYGTSEHVGVQEAVARAMINRGLALSDQGKAEEALDVYERLEEKYGSSEHAGVQEVVNLARQEVNQINEEK